MQRYVVQYGTILCQVLGVGHEANAQTDKLYANKICAYPPCLLSEAKGRRIL